MIILTVLFLILIGLSLRYNWWRKRISYKYPRVLMYHSISNHLGEKHDKWRVEPKDFEKQMKFFHKNGWRSFSLSELTDIKSLPDKSFAITFDDGYRDNFTNAFEILKRYNFKATIYLVPNQIKNHWESQNTKELSELLTKDDIKTMSKSGLVEFGSHTLSHCNLSKIPKEELENEIKNSKIEVEKITNLPCHSFAYPYGKFDDEIVDIVKKSGYKNAVIVKRGVFDKIDNFRIRRIGILGSESFFDFWLKITRVRNKL